MFSPTIRHMDAGNGYRVAAFRETPAQLTQARHHDAGDDLFLSSQWFAAVAECGPLKPIRYVVADDDGEACALFMTAREGLFTRHLASLTNFYTMRFSPTVRPDSPEAILAIVRGIAAERPRWQTVDIGYLPHKSPAAHWIYAALWWAGYISVIYRQGENWYCRTNGLTAADYFNDRPSLRDKIEREARRFARKHQARFRVFTTPGGLPDYQSVYARSWKEPEQYPQFIPKLAQLAADRGALRIGVLYADDIPVAAQLWLVCNGRATIYKVAYDEAYSKLSVGSILAKHMFEHVIEHDHPEEIDYGLGSEPYKRDWMDAKRDIIGIKAFNLMTPGGVAAFFPYYLPIFLQPYALKLRAAWENWKPRTV